LLRIATANLYCTEHAKDPLFRTVIVN